jgi:hypothetical protein
MKEVNDFSATVEQLVRDVVARNSKQEKLMGEMRAALEAHPLLGPAYRSDFPRGEYEISLLINVYVKKHIVALTTIEPLGIASAPKLIARVPVGENCTLLLSQYALPPGERLLRFDSFHREARRSDCARTCELWHVTKRFILSRAEPTTG